jgi:hypothetical protein
MRGGLFWYVVEVDFFLIAFPLIKTLTAYHKIGIITQQESILFERLENKPRGYRNKWRLLF